MKKILFVLMMVGVSLMYAQQQNSFPGYVVNLNGDTELVEIKVNPKKALEQYQRVLYKMANGQQKVSKPKMIKGYGYGDNHYVVGENDGELVFFKVLSNGDLSLYELSYEVLLMNDFKIKSERYYKKHGSDSFVHLKHNKIKKQLKTEMAANDELVKEIESSEEFTDENIVKVFDQYNIWAKSNKG